MAFHERTCVWLHNAPGQMEAAHVRLGDGVLFARGVQTGAAPLPYSLEYELATGPA